MVQRKKKKFWERRKKGASEKKHVPGDSPNHRPAPNTSLSTKGKKIMEKMGETLPF